MVVHAAHEDRQGRVSRKTEKKAEKKAEKVDAAFAALADPTRRRVVELLGRAPHRASELAAITSQSRPGMSRHLRLLREAGLVREEADESDARASLYVLDRRAFDDVQGFLDRVQTFWSDQLASFADHLEARAALRPPKRKRASR